MDSIGPYIIGGIIGIVLMLVFGWLGVGISLGMAIYAILD